MLADLRRSRLWLRRDTFLKGSRRSAHAKDVTWLHASGRELTDADWQDPALRAIAVHMNGVPSGAVDRGDLLVVFNADDVPADLVLPSPPDGAAWRLVFDTGNASRAAGSGFATGQALRVEPHSTVLLESQAT